MSGGSWPLSARLERLGVQAAGVGERDHLPRGVHSGVRAAGPVDRLALPIAEAGQRGLELSLDRPAPSVGPGSRRSPCRRIRPWRGSADGTPLEPLEMWSSSRARLDELDLDDRRRASPRRVADLEIRV